MTDDRMATGDFFLVTMTRRGLLSKAAAAGAGAGLVALGLPALSDAALAALAAGGVVDTAYALPIVNLDPHGASAQETATKYAARQLFDTLVNYNNGKYLPSLATSWSQPDSSTWVFKLRKDVLYHDGTKLVAADVVASVNRIIALKGPIAPLWSTVTSVTAPDPHTVKFATNGSLGTMLENAYGAFVLPAKELAKQSAFTKPIGSGPFICSSFVSSDHLIVKRNPKYWGGAPINAGVKSVYIPEEAGRITALINGDDQITWPVDPDQIPTLQKTNGVKVVEAPSNVIFVVWFNLARKPFSDVNVRKAMWYALDLKTIISTLWGNTGSVATGPVASSVFGFSPQTPYAYSASTAKGLLAQAGYPNGFTTSITYEPGVLPAVDEIAQALASYWSAVGVNVQLQEQQPAQAVTNLLGGNWDMFILPLGGIDADFILGRLYASSAKRMGYWNPEVDTLLAQAKSNTNQQVRKRLYAQVCTILWSDAVSIFAADLKTVYGIRTNVKGFAVNGDGVGLLNHTHV